MRKKSITLILIPFFLIFSVVLQSSEFLNVQLYIATDVNNVLTTAAIWSNATVISDDGTGWNVGNSYIPAIAVDGDGNVHVVWWDDTDGEWGADDEILYANYSGSGWSNTTAISDIYGWNNGVSGDPDIAIDGDGNMHVVWWDDTNGEWGNDEEIMYAKNTVVGWSNATVISDDATGWNVGNSYAPAIAIDSDGNLHVVWEDYTDGEWGIDIEIMYAKHTAAGWSNATVISDDATGWNVATSGSPAIAIDSDGNVHVVWWDDTDGEWGTDYEIMYAKHTGAGWSNATVISDDASGWNDGDSYDPDIAIDGDGNVHIVWHDDTNGEWGTDVEIMYTKHTAVGWSTIKVISDDATGWNVLTSGNPSIAIDGDGNVHVVWRDDTNGEWGTDTEIMYINRTAAGWSNATLISDDASGWNDDNSWNPTIAVDGDGNVHVVWWDDTDGEWGIDPEIMYSKKSASSPPPTPPEERPIYLIEPQGGGDISSFLFSPLGLGIVVGFGAMFLILIAVVINNNKTIKELKKISKTTTSKKSIEK